MSDVADNTNDKNQYVDPGWPATATTDAMFTIEPLLRSRIAGITALQHCHTPFTLTAKMRSHTAGMA